MGALGRALMGAWGGGRKKSYTAKGWRAQFRRLSKTAAGRQALADVGVTVQPRTIRNWLTGKTRAIKANQEKIGQAYAVVAGAWRTENETADYMIKGLIDSGDRIEDRELLIQADRGNWDRIRQEYEAGTLTEDQAERLFIEDVIVEDIGEASGGGWAFPGNHYDL